MGRVCLFTCCFLLIGSTTLLAQDASIVKAHADHLKQGDSKAAAELVRFGAAAVPALIDVLKEGDGFAKSHAAQALGRIGPPAKEAAMAPAMRWPAMTRRSSLRQASHRPDRSRRRAGVAAATLKEPRTDLALTRAAQAAGRIGPAAKEAVPLLAELLKKARAAEQRAAIITALGDIGPSAKSAVPGLIVAIKSPDLDGLPQKLVSTHAVVALGKIGPGAKEAAPGARVPFQGNTRTGRSSAGSRLGSEANRDRRPLLRNSCRCSRKCSGKAARDRTCSCLRLWRRPERRPRNPWMR